MGIFNRALIGGLAGGLMTGDLGGLAGGAAMGIGGWSMAQRLGSKMGGGTTNALRGALSGAERLVTRANTAASSRWASSAGLGVATRGASVMGRASQFGTMANRGIRSASNFIGRNSITTNKIGGYAMGAAGIGAGAYLGSSVLRSNQRQRGY